jgi:uncharacterized protein YjiK
MLLLGTLGCARVPTPSPSPPAAGTLTLERAIPLTGPGDFQPSGLTVREGRLFTVSDKTSDAIFEIDLATGRAVRAIAIRFPGGTPADLDLEGLALDRHGDFLVVSEAHSRVFSVRPSGEARWWPIDLLSPARAAGLLATRGAGFEGVALLGDRLVVAAEREPRGLVVVGPRGPRAWPMQASVVPLAPGRPPDFADLAVDGGHLLALVRNADALVVLRPAGERFEEAGWWSFAAAVAAYPYQDRRFGMAEGLALDADHVYVVLDNNAIARQGAPEDRRALLFVFARPARFW